MSFGEGDLHAQVDRLKELNGALCAEINEKDRRIRDLESLVRDMWAVIQRPYICVDVGVLSERMEELGIEVNGD